ncbi:GNAT family N-acetyltransferase [Xaviernesmea oryzae]|uniref:GNAT family N-acetyltransferase n=1 Tax=Xaviernesmea oryzae TaxID=464029 RepID=A0A1Q9AUA4_9HYPH|nr:GNAT family N-acetyltransferase [Xaviernesmea oryzae]OLP59046.1 GNAT family N-acetyltransferase [Xaviernesmea oryzae]SEK89161.1 N-acetylglutamate synthase, GNAT family [Xaviernesmea oryzae]
MTTDEARVEIRLLDARFDDYDALLDLIRTAFASMDGVIDPPSSAHKLTPQMLAEKACTEIGLIAVSPDQPERLLGCAFLRPEAEALYIGKLAVAPLAEGRGIGRALLMQAERIAQEKGLARLRLETRIELTRNHQVFAAWGFHRTAENAHPGYDRVTSVEMSKPLS